jgi:hypothetical protein
MDAFVSSSVTNSFACLAGAVADSQASASGISRRNHGYRCSWSAVISPSAVFKAHLYVAECGTLRCVLLQEPIEKTHDNSPLGLRNLLA